MKKFLLLFCLVVIAAEIKAQLCEQMLQSANECYNKGNYVEARVKYLFLKNKCSDFLGTEAEKKLEECDRMVEEDVVFQKCSTIAACDSYLRNYPNGRYVEKVKTMRRKLGSLVDVKKNDETN